MPQIKVVVTSHDSTSAIWSKAVEIKVVSRDEAVDRVEEVVEALKKKGYTIIWISTRNDRTVAATLTKDRNKKSAAVRICEYSTD